jgi:type IV secretory pathway VirB4 component
MTDTFVLAIKQRDDHKKAITLLQNELDASNEKIISTIVQKSNDKISLYAGVIDAARSSAKIQTDILDSVKSLHKKLDIFTDCMRSLNPITL